VDGAISARFESFVIRVDVDVGHFGPRQYPLYFQGEDLILKEPLQLTAQAS